MRFSWSMNKLYLVLAVLCVTGTAADTPRIPAQTPQQPEPGVAASDTRIVLDVNRVNILFTVTDKKGRFVTNLGKDDFDVLQDKKSQEIVEFAAESDLPLRLAVLIDSSNSIRDRFRFQQEAAVEFFHSRVGPAVKAATGGSYTGAEIVAGRHTNIPPN